MIEIGPMPPSGGIRAAVERTARSRLTERHVLSIGLALSAAFLLATAVAGVLTLTGQIATWTVIHLALAGAATVAIGTFMPHFGVTLAGSRPLGAAERLTALALLAAGAALVVIGVTSGARLVPGAGAVAMLIGIALVARQTFAPMRDPLARRHPIVAVTYGVALVELAAAVVLGALGAIGLPAIVSAWGLVRPAHAWLALFGAVSLTIFATLVYLAPTVLGARIRAGAGLVVATVGLTVGPPLVAVGFVLDARTLVIAAVGVTAGGAVGQIAYLVDVLRRRGSFTSEHDWRRVASGHLLAGSAWLLAAVGAALVALVNGTPLLGWSLGTLAIPMVGGWMLQELMGSWTHLVPSVTPGGAEHHRRQRRVLAVASRSRLVAWNAGVALLWLGVALSITSLAVAGVALLATSFTVAVVALLRALATARY